MPTDTDTAVQGLIAGSREFLRDFPMFFETDIALVDITTFRLPHPLVSSSALQVVTIEDEQMVPVPADAIQLDQRNGLLKFMDPSYLGKRVMVNGYHYTWFLDADLAFHAQRSLIDVSYGQEISSMEDFSLIETDTIIMGTIVSALWSLTTELALDIDVSTPEGMYIPARQRYAQALQMWQSWSAQFNERMQNLNLGTGKLEQFYLRRVARLTNRLVPLYVPREVDSRLPPRRIYPSIPSGEQGSATIDRGSTIEEIGRMGQEVDWETIGTGGGGTPDVAPAAAEVAVQDGEPTRPGIVLWVDTDEEPTP
jgi:hypothetical protein